MNDRAQETRAFFGPRAVGWNVRFAEDGPAFDLTPEMLRAARAEGGPTPGRRVLVLGDAERLPIRSGSFDAIFAAGLLAHLVDPLAGLVELARVARSDAVLGLFHPVGRATLAHEHGHELRPDDPLDPGFLTRMFQASGWTASMIDDSSGRYLALARLNP